MTPAYMVISCSVQKERKSIPLLGDIDRVVPLSLEIVKRHLTRSQVFPYLAETYRALESSHFLFFCFVHLNHCMLIFSVQMYELSAKLPKKSTKTCQRAPCVIILFPFCLFHRFDHRLDKLYFLIRQAVLGIEFCIRPRFAEVLEGNKFEDLLCHIDRRHKL